MARRLLPWVLRVLWATLPITAGPALAAALDHRSGPVQVATSALLWVGWLAAPAAGILLLAAKQWVAGAIVLVLANGAAFVAVRALHGLSRRWVVFVPAGVVLHDPMATADPVLFPRQVIETLRPAPADTDS